MSSDPADMASDPLVLTACQYDRQSPGSDLCALLSGAADLDERANAGPGRPGTDTE
jgi:hypothetical protein